MTRRLEVQYAVSRYQSNVIDGQRVRVDVVFAEGMPSKVFAYNVEPLSPMTGSERAQFSHVCSPTDLEEFPENTPLSGRLPEWFRLDYVDIVVGNSEIAQNFIEILLEDLRALRATLIRMDTLGEPTTVWIGDPPDESSSSSISESL